MSTDKHERQYQAYQALKGLSDLTADTMKQIAYEQMDHIDWVETCRRHRQAFARWMEYAESQGSEDAPRLDRAPRQFIDSVVKK
ncbi:hypothetical protein KSS93_15160 [Pseudomonas xanthosomatis]|uniref:hypothetical protein n=1 Tax=Pseudomonas xanthosomatis TaxID=2842356 RepID=UPI001C3CDB72|nr:hypothetical protein [Pseudomonas xanthosomatis]QXH44235.1 hypothetical protein KSS93_15160 [Pseudomonas xanthosomatis]